MKKLTFGDSESWLSTYLEAQAAYGIIPPMTKKQTAKKAADKKAAPKKAASSTKAAGAKEQKGTSLLIPNVKLKITLPKKSVAEAYDRALATLAKTVSATGFRQGKVPKKLAEEKIGRGRVIEQTLNELLPKAYEQAVKDSNKKPMTRPEFSIVSAEKDQDWVVEAQFAELPTVKLGKYQQLAKAGLKEAKKVITDRQKAAKKDKKSPAPTAEQEKEINLQHIFRELVTQLKPQVPELLLKHETQHEFEHLTGQLKQLGTSVDDYLKRRQMNMEQLSQELAVSTLNRLQLDLVLGAIAKEEKLTVSDKDRDNYFKQIPDEKQREQLRNDTHYLGHLDANLTKQKVIDYLLGL